MTARISYQVVETTYRNGTCTVKVVCTALNCGRYHVAFQTACNRNDAVSAAKQQLAREHGVATTNPFPTPGPAVPLGF